jgi:capsular polysaccharide biosynthesis protein
VNDAETRYATAADNIETAELAIERTRADVTQRLQVVDPPSAATAPVSTRRDDVMTIALYLTVGCILSGVLIALLTFLDRSFHNAGDVRSRLGADVLASVPEVAPNRRTPVLAAVTPDIAAGSTSAVS